MKGLRSTAILALLVAGLWLLLSRLGGELPAPDLTESALDERSLLQADAVIVRNQLDVPSIELRRAAGRAFELVEPVVDLASQAKIAEIAAAFDSAQLAPAHRPEDVTDDLLQQTGLDRPRAELQVVYPDRRVRLEIGEDGPLGHDVFVRKNGSIYWASKALLSVLGGTADDFRERALFVTTSGEVRRLTVIRKAAGGEPSRLSLRQVGSARYRIEEPIQARAHLAGAESFVQSVLGLRVGQFVPGNMEAPANPDWVIEVEGDAGIERLRLWRQPNTMLLGLQEPRQLAFMIEDREYSRMFDVAAERLRSQILVPLATEDIAHVVLDPGAPGRAAVLRRGGDGVLELEQPVRSRAHSTAVLEMLEAIAKLKAAEFVDAEAGDLERFGLAQGYFSVQVKGMLDPRPITVHLGREEGEHCYARRADEPDVVKVAAADVRDLRRSWVDYVDRQVHRQAAVNVVGLRLRRGGDRRTYERADGVWRLPGGEVDGAAVESAVETLTHLDARRVLDPASLGEPESGVTLELLGLQEVVFQQMTLWRRGEATLLRLPGRDVVYELRDGDAAALWKLAP